LPPRACRNCSGSRIEGEWYWDGGYSGNPTLWPLIGGRCRARSDRGPATPAIRRIAEGRRVDPPPHRGIVFHSSLVSEMQAIAAMRAVATRGAAAANVLDWRMHRIGPPRAALFDQGRA